MFVCLLPIYVFFWDPQELKKNSEDQFEKQLETSIHNIIYMVKRRNRFQTNDFSMDSENPTYLLSWKLLSNESSALY